MPTNDDLARLIAALPPGVPVTPEELLAELRRQAGPPTGNEPTTPPGVDPEATTPPIPSADGERGDAPPGYELLGELGRGGMGVVYRARQVALNRDVALEMILSGAHAGADERQRFLAEAEAIAKVKHVGIVQVYDFGTHGGLPYFSLELCEGGSLAGRLRDGPLPPREAAVIVEQIARAVQAAHDAGIVHRDLKPGNVLIAHDGSPRVTDFGLAKRAEGGGNTQTGAAVGTPSYMAPEQAEGKKTVGPPADVWALGAILYACLTGRPPFQAATTMDTLLQVVADDPVPVRRLNGKVPRDLETVCHKCLQKEPGRRYGSAAALADDLKRWLEGKPITARPVGRIERLWSWCKREPVTASLISAVAVVLVAATVVAWGLAGWALGEKGRADYEAGEKGREATAARKAEKEAKDNEELAIKRKEAADFQAFRAEDACHKIQMDLALEAWQKHDVARAEQVLGEVAPQFQQVWEVLHFRALCRRKSLPLIGHTRRVTSVAFSPDGKRIASGSWDNTLKVWDAETGQEKITLKGHTDCVSGVAFSPDGKRILSGSGDKTLKVWDAETGQEKLSLRGHTGGVNSVAFSLDGQRIVSGSEDKTLRVWDTGLTALQWHESQAKHNEEYKYPFAAAFHLERLHRLRPGNADVRHSLQAALKADAPGIDLIRDRHRAFTAALPFLRAAALVGTPPLALPAVLP